jgi:DnaJ-domain-containing protein 1
MYVVIAILLIIAINVIIAMIKAGVKAGYNKITEPSDALKKTEKDADSVARHYGMSPDDALRYKNMQRFGTCFARFALLVSMADNKLEPSEGMAILEFFRGADPNYLKGIQDSLKKDLSNPSAIDWDHNIRIARGLFSDSNLKDYDSVLFDGLLSIAAADGDVAESELKSIIGIMGALGWTGERIQAHIKQRFSGVEEFSAEEKRARAYQTLGLCHGCSGEEIKRAYRTLAKQYHPDMVRHLGASLQKSATERFHEIRNAYEYLSELS